METSTATFFAVTAADTPEVRLTLSRDATHRLLVDLQTGSVHGVVILDARAARRLANAVLGEFGRGGVALEVL